MKTLQEAKAWAELKKCYQRAMSKAHPDKGGDEEMASRINAAYEQGLAEL